MWASSAVSSDAGLGLDHAVAVAEPELGPGLDAAGAAIVQSDPKPDSNFRNPFPTNLQFALPSEHGISTVPAGESGYDVHLTGAVGCDELSGNVVLDIGALRNVVGDRWMFGTIEALKARHR